MGPMPAALMMSIMADAELGRVLVPADSAGRRRHQGRVLAAASAGNRRQGRVLFTTPPCNQRQGRVSVTTPPCIQGQGRVLGMASIGRGRHQGRVLITFSAGNHHRGWDATTASVEKQWRGADGREQGHLRWYREGRPRPATAAAHMEGWLRTRLPSFAAARHSGKSGRGIK